MSLPSLLRQARASAEAGRLDRALDAAERAFRQFPGHPEASQLFGRLLIQAIGGHDLILIRSLVLFYVATAIIMNALVDLAYGVADPRLRVGRR